MKLRRQHFLELSLTLIFLKKILLLLLCKVILKVVSWEVMLVLPGILSEIQILRSYVKPTESETLIQYALPVISTHTIA